MTISPLITSAENLYDVQGQLAKLGYNSVFDVVGIPRERFVLQHRDTLGRNAGQVYDLLIGYALQVDRQFRHRSAAATSMAPQGPFSKPGPDYASLFFKGTPGWKDKAPSGALEANDGPVAYLAYLYGQVQAREGPHPDPATMNPLSKRRPDLPNLLVDDAAVNQEIPQIQLVNEVLASAIQSAQGLTDFDAVNQLLGKTRYPNNLPYLYANQQMGVVQSALNIFLSDYLLPQNISLLQAFWSPQAALNASQAADLARLQIMASQLGPEQQRIVAEAPYFGNYHLVLSDLYDPQDQNKCWQSYSMTDGLVNIPATGGAAGGFTLPIQYSVDEYGGRPQPPTVEGTDKGNSSLRIVFFNQGNDAQAAVMLTAWHNQFEDGFPINVSQEGQPIAHKDVLCISYPSGNTQGMDLSTPWYAQFALSYYLFSTDIPKRYLTISVYLSSDPTARYTATQTGFYTTNFGPGASLSSFMSMQGLTSRTGLTVPDVEKMFCATGGGATAFTVVQSANYVPVNTVFKDGQSVYASAAVPFVYGAKFIHAGYGPAIYLTKDQNADLQIMSLTDDRLDRMNRIIRVQKWLGLPFEDVDLLLTSAMEAEGSDGGDNLIAADEVTAANGSLVMNDNTLRMLGVFQYYQKTYGVSAKQFAAWLYLVTPFAITPEQPFLDQVFNSTGSFDTPLIVDGTQFTYTDTSGPESVFVKKICAALGISHHQFLTLAQEVSVQYQLSDGDFLKADLFVLSSLYRLVSIANVLGMSPDDFYALAQLLDQGSGTILKQLAGQPVIATPVNGAALGADFLTLLSVLSTIAQWLQKRELSVPMVSAMIRPVVASAGQATAYQFTFVQDVCRQLANTMVDAMLFKRSGAPPVDTQQKPIDWLTLFQGAKLIDDTGLVTDIADTTEPVPINGKTVNVITAVKNVVDGQQLSTDDNSLALVSLNAAVLQAQQTQTGIAASLLGKLLEIDQSLAPLVLRWAGQTPYQWLLSIWQLKNSLNTAADIPAVISQTLGEIARRALLCQEFSLSPAGLQYLLASPDQFGLPSPYNGSVDFPMLYMLGRYDDLLYQAGAVQGGTEDDILSYLQHANNGQLTDPAQAAELVATLLGWKPDEVQAAWGLLGGSIAKTVPQLDLLMRLQQAHQDTGLSVSLQQQAFVLDRASPYAAWQAVGQAMVGGANYVNGVNS